MIVVVGLGPAGPELTTPASSEALEQAARDGSLFLRTGRHPAAEPYLARRGVVTFDEVYDRAPTFGAVYDEIARVLLSAALSGARPGALARDSSARGVRTITYAVPGSPLVAEATVTQLRLSCGRATHPLEILPALSFADLAWARLALDPVVTGVRLIDGTSFGHQAAGCHGALLVAQCWSRRVLSDIKLAVDDPRAGQRATLLHHLGLPDEQVLDVAWEDLDRTIEPDHLTSLYVEGLAESPLQEMATFVATVERLRQDCPWDREQTHQSLVRHLLEESYEAIEAIEALGATTAEGTSDRSAHVEEELGDLLCQVVFHAVLGAEEGLFNLASIARSVNDKLVTRHPHVFGDLVAETAAEVASNWERIKQQEKRRSHLLEGIPHAMPALARAATVERKLASIGLGAASTEPGDPTAPIGLGTGPGWDDDLAEGAVTEAAAGEALLGLARRLAHAGIDPEAALRHALDRLEERVAALDRTTRLEQWATGGPDQ